MDTRKLNRILSDLGHPDLRSYQRFHDLEVDGIFGRVTQRHISLPRCGMRDQIVTDGICHWGREDTVLSYWVDPRLPSPIHEMIQPAFDAWSPHIRIRFIQTDQPAESNWTIEAHRLDGRGNVLADQELPCGLGKRVRMRVDISEIWTVRPGRGRILAYNVLLHEIGHGLGIPHTPSGVMAAIYNPRSTILTESDVAEAELRLGGRPPLNGEPPRISRRLRVVTEADLTSGELLLSESEIL